MSLETQIKALERRIEAARGRPRTKSNIKALEEMTRSLYNLKAQKDLKIKTA
mgnify:CR=1 FL=1|tara:strand:- start:41 stop:196 length:156 start_codon:yes stop_codon:yes gene_type:complete